jgi:hypothetical protein
MDVSQKSALEKKQTVGSLRLLQLDAFQGAIASLTMDVVLTHSPRNPFRASTKW